MTDDLEKLAAALKAAAPSPDPDRKAEALAASMKAYDRQQELAAFQGSRRDARPMSDRPAGAGILTGVLRMFSYLSIRPALAATASVAALAVGLGAIYVQRPNLFAPGVPGTAPAGEAITGSSPGTANDTARLGSDPADEARQQRDETPAEAATSAPTVMQKSAEAAPEDQPVVEPMTDALTEPARRMEAPAGVAASEEGDARTRAMTADTQAEAPVAAESPLADYGMANAGNIEGELFLGAPASPVTSDDLAAALPQPDTEVYSDAAQNPVKIVAEEPVSTFSIDVDTASYSVVRSSLMAGYLPPPEAVRIEEMVNYFPYAYPAPGTGDAPFRPTVTVIPSPWNEGTRLVHIGIQGRMPAVEERPPLNLVFLIDTSGSMDEPNKLPLLISSFQLMLDGLRPEDQIAIVTYAGSAGLVLEPTPASDRAKISAALRNVAAGGSTAGQEGLQQAYAVAEGMAAEGEVTRVVLATDGDFNVGISDPAELETFIAKKRETGAYLSVIGFGRGNLDDATMQALAQNGNGTAAYIDTMSEAQKVMVDQLTGALFPIADDVKIQVEFNPAVIAEYRLIGYETRALAREDFNNDKVDAGEIGAGHTVTAIYEVTPVGSPAVLSDPLRYQNVTEEAAPELAPAEMELGFLKLRYKEPGEAESQLVEVPIRPELGTATDDIRFAAATAGFGQLLTDTKYLGDWGWDDAIALATGAKGEDPFGYRAEAVQLMRLAESLSAE